MLARQPKHDDGTAEIAVARAVHAYEKQQPYASAVELDEVRAKARAKQGHKSVPYFDETISTVKSASVLHASYRVGAMLERADGRTEQAAMLDARADATEGALVDAARDAVHWLEQHAAYTRTGYRCLVGRCPGCAAGPRLRWRRSDQTASGAAMAEGSSRAPAVGSWLTSGRNLALSVRNAVHITV